MAVWVDMTGEAVDFYGLRSETEIREAREEYREANRKNTELLCRIDESRCEKQEGSRGRGSGLKGLFGTVPKRIGDLSNETNNSLYVFRSSTVPFQRGKRR